MCLPSYEPSLTISANQNCTKKTNITKLIKTILPPITYLFTHNKKPAKTLNNDIETRKGHGDGFTI